MYEQLVHLSEFSQPLGVFKISRAIYTWEEKFNDHPLHAQVIELLFKRGNEQKSWYEFRTTEKPRTVTDGLVLDISKMRLNDREAPQDTPGEPQSPTDAQGLDDNDTGDSEKGQQEERIDWNYLHERIQYAEEQCLVLQNLAGSSLFDLSRSLRICRLIYWLRHQIQILRADEFKEERPDKMVGEVEDFIKPVASAMQLNVTWASYLPIYMHSAALGHVSIIDWQAWSLGRE